MYKLVVLSVFLALSLAEEQPWTGPFADHVLGQLVGDTPEVAAAKQQHLRAHNEIRAVLPELPIEEQFPESRNVNPTNIVHTPQVHHQQPQQVFPKANNFFPQTNNVFPQIPRHTQFQEISQPQQHFTNTPIVPEQPKILAEEIPRSIIGEVPEVHAARQAHLKAFNEIRAALPVLREDTSTARSFASNVPVVPQNLFVPGLQQGPLDTPEVMAAKLAHARAIAALGR